MLRLRLLDFPIPTEYRKIVENSQGQSYSFPVDANAMDGQCRTALYTAVADGHLAMTECLLDYRVQFSDGSDGCPFQVDVYCIRGRTPLMMAAFNQNIGLLQLLLQHGADVNLPLGVLEDSDQSLESARCVGSGSLAEAARSGGLHVVQLLLQNGAIDTDNRALSIASQGNNEKIVRVLLCKLAHPDAEYKVNKRNVDVGQVRVGESLLPSSLCPSRGASLAWASASLTSVLPDWFVAAALHVNPRLKTTRLALAAITRVDLSCNRLTVFPSVLLQMPSLRLLNLAQNQISVIEPPSYAVSCQSVETLNLSHNKLEALSAQLLSTLPSLANLDISHNKITHLPESIWLCPALKELNAAHNSLSALPSLQNRARLSRTANVGQAPDGLVSQESEDTIVAQGERMELRRENIWMGEIPLCKVEEEASDVPLSSSGTLTTLNLQANKLSVFPSCLACVCPRLLTLNLSFNLLHQLAPIQNWEEDACAHKRHDSLQWCKTLNVLDVSDNRLTSLPSHIGHIATLAVLNLNGNIPLETLPAEVGLLSRLWSLSLKGCKLKEPLNSMVNAEQCKTVQLVAFLKSILEQAKAYRHMRLLFVGSPGSGRTTLWEAVRPYAMIRRAVYVLVFRITDGEEGLEQAEKLLIGIQARAPNACVVVVGTHRDHVTQNEDRFSPGFLEKMEQRCRHRWLVADSDKKGLPKVIDVLLLSAKLKAAVKTVAQSILRAAWEAKMGRERLLDSPVPSAHVLMIKILRQMNAERRDGELAVHALMGGDELRGRATAPVIHFTYQRAVRYRRLFSLAYMPAGFWSRLITRMMGDASVSRAVSQIFACEEPGAISALRNALKGRVVPEWMVWESGLELVVKGHSLLILKQFLPLAEVRDLHYGQSEWTLKHEGHWRASASDTRPIVEVLIPSLSMTVVLDGSNRVEMGVDEAAAASLLALVTDLVDTLLEDWYPSLGTRFVHSSEGDLLVQRLIPCHRCASEEIQMTEGSHDDSALPGTPMDGGSRKSSIGLRSRTLNDMRLGRKRYAYTIEECISGELVDAAVKMLEPVDPGQARGSAVNAYRAGLAKWERDEGENACRAYCTCRQELFLLVRMRHPSVLSLLGVSFPPLSLVVELAPLGALSQLLSSYRKSGCRLGLQVLTDTLTQVAKALEYLHQQHIIYRDLKSENVLAWRYPPPFANLVEVLVKLGDYGISRSILPSGGAKGFGGTEGFMAPEIVRFNGEEEYTQQVDSFSFGMFCYELLSLRLPFDGEDHVKERLLDGARPFLLPHELLLPSLMLDTMVLCWRSSPSLRPTSSHLVSLVGAPEFPRLLDTLNLSSLHAPPPCLASIVTTEDWDDDELDAEVWLTASDNTLHCLSCTQFGWTEHRRTTVPISPTWLLRGAETGTMWGVSRSGTLAVFSASLNHSTNLDLPVDGQQVVCRPALLSSDLLCLPCTSSLCLIRMDYAFSISLLARHPATAIKGLIALNADEARQVWTGHDDGVIQAHTIGSDDRFCFASSLSHPEAQGPIDLLEADAACRNVWAASTCGCRVFCWDVARRVVVSILNIRKVAPGWETISATFPGLLSSSVVTSLALLDRGSASTLFIGTSAGVLIAANALTLQPMLACRPYEGTLTSLTIIETGRWNDESRRRVSVHTSDSMGSLTWMRDRVSETVDRLRGAPQNSPIPPGGRPPAVLVSTGTRYRSATERICGPESAPTTTLHSAVVHPVTAIIWKADEWLP
ncbi:unnamed protein product, partial [Mesorhabditis spiculigera]